MGVGREEVTTEISAVTLKPEKNGVREEKINPERNEFWCVSNNTAQTPPNEITPKEAPLTVSIREPKRER